MAANVIRVVVLVVLAVGAWYFVSSGCAPESPSVARENLFDLVYLGDLEAIQERLDRFPTLVNARREEDGSTPLHVAARSGHWKISNYLCAKGANVDARDDKAQTALYVAVSEGKVEVAEGLLAEGADVDVRDSRGNTCLHLAVRQASITDDPEVVDLLLANGVDVRAKNYEGESPLMIAQARNLNEIVKKLEDHGANR